LTAELILKVGNFRVHVAALKLKRISLNEPKVSYLEPDVIMLPAIML
jgi:hypothetical protein